MNSGNGKLIRFQQRRSNLNQAIEFLKETLESEITPARIRHAASIKAFEMAFELCWKSLKDLLEFNGVTVSTPREVIKESFKAGYINDGQIWIDFLDQRNALVHVDSEAQATAASDTIKSKILPSIEALGLKLNQQ